MNNYILGTDLLSGAFKPRLESENPTWRQKVAQEAALTDPGRWEKGAFGFWHWRHSDGSMSSAPEHVLRAAYPGMAPLFDLKRPRPQLQTQSQVQVIGSLEGRPAKGWSQPALNIKPAITPEVGSTVTGTIILGTSPVMTEDQQSALTPDQAYMLRSAAVRFLIDHAGIVPYIWGGHSLEKGPASHPNEIGLDCTGAVALAYDTAGITKKSAGRFAADDWERSLKKIEQKDLQIGDLVFYGNKSKPATHVMMIAQLDPPRVIGSTGGGSKTVSVAIANATLDKDGKGAGVKVKDLNYRPDIISFGQAPVGTELHYVPPLPAQTWKLAVGITGGIFGLALLSGLGYYLGTLIKPTGAASL